MTYPTASTSGNTYIAIKPPTLQGVVAEYLKRIGVKGYYWTIVEDETDILLGITFENEKDRFIFKLAGDTGCILIDLEHEYKRRKALFSNMNWATVSNTYV